MVATVAVTPEPDPRLDAFLDSQGIEAVRELLRRSPGADPGAIVLRLWSQEHPVERGYAQAWVERRAAEQQRRQERSRTIELVLAAVGAAATVIGVLTRIIHRAISSASQRDQERERGWRRRRADPGLVVADAGLGRGTLPRSSGRSRGPGRQQHEAAPVGIAGGQRHLDPGCQLGDARPP